MLLVDNYDKYLQAKEFINGCETLAYDTETTGLNPRKDKVIGFGVSNGLDGFYVPVFAWSRAEAALLPVGIGIELCKDLLSALLSRKLIMFNAPFDILFTKYDLKVDLTSALHTDALLLKHICDQDYPFGLKEIATKLWGHNVKKEKEEMVSSIKANGGGAKEYFKADLQLLAKYCLADCILTYRVYNHYSKEIGP